MYFRTNSCCPCVSSFLCLLFVWWGSSLTFAPFQMWNWKVQEQRINRSSHVCFRHTESQHVYLMLTWFHGFFWSKCFHRHCISSVNSKFQPQEGLQVSQSPLEVLGDPTRPRSCVCLVLRMLGRQFWPTAEWKLSEQEIHRRESQGTSQTYYWGTRHFQYIAFSAKYCCDPKWTWHTRSSSNYSLYFNSFGCKSSESTSVSLCKELWRYFSTPFQRFQFIITLQLGHLHVFGESLAFCGCSQITCWM